MKNTDVQLTQGKDMAFKIMADAKMVEELNRKRPHFQARNLFSRALRSLRRLAKAKERQIPGKPWTWGFHELPDATETQLTRQILRRALRKTAYLKLKEKYGGMFRQDLRPLATGLAYKTFRETPKPELEKMYRDAEKLGRVR